jgi:hypothetical protein
VDSLLAFIIALLIGDDILLSIWQSCGATQVIVTDASIRALAAYPKIIVWAEEGAQIYSGDTDPSFFNGKFHLDIFTRQSDSCVDGQATLYQIVNRVKQLLLGDLNDGLEEIRGQQVSRNPNLYISAFQQISPTGRISTTDDPTVRRHTATYAVTVNVN